MSISKAASHRDSSGDLGCPQCGTPLSPQATFCSSCGERLDKKKAVSSLLQVERDIKDRYRITSLVRRHPYVNLYFALDNQLLRQGQQRMVAIRDIDINSLQDEERVQAIELAQQEYDLLRLWHLPHVMSVVDLRYFHGHLFVVSGYPPGASSQGTSGESENTQVSTGNERRLYTLQDFLQSGQGLPSEQQALKWIGYLCQALEGLHSHQIVIGELDPYTIVLDENSSDAEPALMLSWWPPQLQRLLRSFPPSARFWSYFCAPEALEGKAELRSDIYSLGAVLYLLLTGSPPVERVLRTRGRLRPPRELNSRISAHVNDCVMQALSIEPSKRFQNVREMSETLFNPRYRRLQTLKLSRGDNKVTDSSATDEVVETIHTVPLSQQHVDRWRTSRPQTPTPGQIPHRPLTPLPTSQPEEVEAIQAEWQQQPVDSPQSLPAPATPTIEASIEAKPIAPDEQADKQETSESQQTALQDAPAPSPAETSQNASMPDRKQRSMVMKPAISFEWLKKSRSRPEPVAEQSTSDTDSQNEAANSRFKQLQSLVLGQQKREIMAAALIESPTSVQPHQVFALRMHIAGRDEAKFPPATQKEEGRFTWLSSLAHGDTLLIEVRVVLYQKYTYEVQRATVPIPQGGYIAEVTIPIQPLASAPSGRRDRLHIFFFDKQRNLLYDKPFVTEVFVSHLVKRGHEGHRVLTIPV